MTRSLFVVVFLAAAVASAQQMQRHAPTPMQEVSAQPSDLGRPFLRAPLLRSWVQGWNLTGSKVEAYEVRSDEAQGDLPILRTKSTASDPFGTGSLTHVESAVPWRGLRVELRAELRAGRIGGWAGLWMRVDDAEGKVLAFDNMQNRPLRGTSSFEWYTVVLDVPETAERVSFGVLLHGPGAVHIRELHFEEATAAVGTTDLVGPLRAQR